MHGQGNWLRFAALNIIIQFRRWKHQAADFELLIEALARWADAAVLRDAFELTCALRMEHQVEQLRAGEAPDNLIDPKRLTPLTRTSLKEAFRAVAKVQRGIGAKQGFTWR